MIAARGLAEATAAPRRGSLMRAQTPSTMRAMTTPSPALLRAWELAEQRTLERFPEVAARRLRPVVTHEERLQAAQRLRETHSGIPFYAKRAQETRLAGDEMAYWLSLQSTEATLKRP